MHPSDHDPPALRSQKCLRRVKVNAIIHGHAACFRKGHRFLIQISDQTERIIAPMKFKAFREHIHHTYDQHMLSVKREEIRTFPHHTETVIIADQRLHIFPLKSVITLIKKNLSACLRVSAGKIAIVASFRTLFQIGIPEIKAAAPLWDHIGINDRILRHFLIIDAVSHCDTLCLYFPHHLTGLFFFADRGIHEELPAIFQLDRAAGKTAVAVIFPVRRERGRQVLPVQQIIADYMSPMYIVPPGRIGIILEKHMITVLITGKTVWIIQPSGRGGQMVNRSLLF